MPGEFFSDGERQEGTDGLSEQCRAIALSLKAKD